MQQVLAQRARDTGRALFNHGGTANIVVHMTAQTVVEIYN